MMKTSMGVKTLAAGTALLVAIFGAAILVVFPQNPEYDATKLREVFALSMAAFCVMSWTAWQIFQRQSKSEAGLLQAEARIRILESELEQSRATLKPGQESCDLAAPGYHEGVWDWDIEHDKVFFSELAHQQIGYTTGEIDTNDRQWLLSLIHPDDREKVDAAVKEHLEQKAPYNVEFRVLSKNGEYRWIHSRGQAVWDANGKPIRFSGSRRDITEQMRAQNMLKQIDNRFQQMANSIHEIFWITDARGAVPIFVSPAYEQIYGRSIESLFQFPKQFFEATHPDDRERLATAIRKQRKVEHSCEVEFRIIRPDGEIRWIWARLSPIIDEHGQLTGLCGISNDITQKKESEKRVSEFYSMVSHELRTPLTSIRGSLKLIEGGRTGELPEKAMQLIRIGCAESDRLMRLINDILDIKKVEGGLFDLEKKPIEPEQLLNRAVDGMAGVAAEAGVSLRTSKMTRRLIYGDFERLLQVLTNLISNAIKFSDENTEVIVTAEDRGDDAIRYVIVDRGPGIPDNQKHKLFSPFQQLDSSDSRLKGGTGLGLAISKSIVELHGGRIGLETIEGEGSEFWFEVPVYHESLQDAVAKSRRLS